MNGGWRRMRLGPAVVVALLTLGSAAVVLSTGGRQEVRSAEVESVPVRIVRPDWGEVIADDASSVRAAIEAQLLDDRGSSFALEFEVVPGVEYGRRLTYLLRSAADIDAFLVAPHELDFWTASGTAQTDLEPLLSRHAPGLRAAIPESAWDAVRIDGRIVAIPAFADPRGLAILVRADILAAAGFSVPRTLAQLERVARALSDGPGTADAPIAAAWWDLGPFLCPALDAPHWEQQVFDHDRRLMYGGNKSEAFAAFLTTIHSWIEAGILDRSIFEPDFATLRERFITGRSPFILQHVNRIDDWQADLPPGAEIAVITQLDESGVWLPHGVVPQVLLLAARSQRTAAVLSYLDWLFADRLNYRLAEHGIEGIHHEPQGTSVFPVMPRSYADMYLALRHEGLATPDASRSARWFSAMELVRATPWSGNSGPFPPVPERFRRLEAEFAREWWRFLVGERDVSGYSDFIADYFAAGGDELASLWYRASLVTAGE